MTKEIFTLIAGLVLAFITATTVGLFDVLGHPANLFAIFFLVILALVSFAEDKAADAARISTWLKRRDGPMLYTRAVQGLMRTLDRLLMPATAADQPMPARGLFARWDWLTESRARDESDLRRLRQNPWSWPVYDAALKLAFLYPIFLAMAQWAWTGASTGLGAVALFPEEPRDWLRAALFYPIALAIMFRLAAAATLRRFYEIAAVSLAVFAVAFAIAGVGLDEVATVVTFAGSVAVAFAFAGTFVFASALAVASVVTVAGANAGAGAGAFAVAGVVAAIPGQFTRLARGGWGYALFTCVLLSALLAVALFAGFPADNPVPASVWLFLGVLPLVNAVFDWLSYGLTIWLIRAGNRRKGFWTLVFGVIDAASAAVLFFALSLTLTCIIGWTNAGSASPVLDLGGLFAGLADPETRGAHFWVAGMIFSTLVPTVVHLIIVALSAITWAPPKLREWCEAGIGQRHVSGQAFTLAAIVVSVLYAGYALILTWGLFALGGMMMTGVSAAIPWYLQLVETCAHALGAM